MNPTFEKRLPSIKTILTSPAYWAAVSIFVMIWITRHFWLAPFPGGWDTMPQINLFYKMDSLLRAGRVFGYDMDWFGGYPVFFFYGFLPYLSAALIHVGSFGAVSVLATAKLAFVGSLAAFSIVFLLFCTTFFGKKAALPSIVALQAFLYHRLNMHMGIGINGALSAGLFNGIWGITIVLAVLIFLRQYLASGRRGWFAGACLLFAILVWTHMLSGVLAAVLVTLYFLMNKRVKDWLVFGSVVVALASFALFPYIAYHELMNGRSISAHQLVSPIPLLLGFHLFPAPGSTWAKHLSTLPYVNLFLAAGFLVSLRDQWKKKAYFFPTVFGLCFVFLYGDYFYSELPVPLHYYRFHAMFYVLYLALSADGIKKIWEASRPAARRLLLLFLLIGTFSLIITFPNRTRHGDDLRRLSEEPELLKYLGAKNVAGRVFVEQARSTAQPHYFDSLLPLKHGIPVGTGLLAESAENIRFYFPLFDAVSNSLLWGGYDELPEDVDLGWVFDRLREHGFEYVVLREKKSVAELEAYRADHPGKIADPAIIESFFVYPIPDFSKRIVSMPHKPVLMVFEDYPVKKEAMMESLFLETDGPGMKLAFLDRDGLGDPDEMEKFETIIVAIGDVTNRTLRAIERLSGKNLIFLAGAVENADLLRRAGEKGGNSVVVFHPSHAHAMFEQLRRMLAVEPPSAEPSITRWSDTAIDFAAMGPTLVNIGYFPLWKNNGRRVYRLMTNQILVFGEGENRMRFAPSVAHRVFMGVSFIAFLGLVLWAAPVNKKRRVGGIFGQTR